MPRNSSGVYTLPEAAFVAGTTILSAAVNSDFSDLATAMTESLAITGVSSMTGPLKLSAGSAAAPSLTLVSDTDTGWYNSAAGAWAFVSNAIEVVEISATGVDITGVLSASGAVTFLSTLAVTGAFSVGAITAVSASTPLSVRDTTNNTSEQGLITFGLGSGVGVNATLRALGTGANDITDILLYIDTTKLITFTSTLITSALDFNIGASLKLDTSGYFELTEIAAPGAGAANVARLYSVDDTGTTRLAYVDSAGTITTLYPATTQAIQETGTANTSYVTPGTQKFNKLHPKAWVLYNIATSTILDSAGVSGVVKNATGDITVSFSTAFSSTNYGVTGFARATGATSEGLVTIGSGGAKAVGSMQIEAVNAGGTNIDSTEVFLAFWGDV